MKNADNGTGIVPHYSLYAYPNFTVRYLLSSVSRDFGGPPHLHNTGEFVVVERGRSHVTIDEESFSASGRFMIYFPPRVYHAQINSREQDYDRYYFSMDEEYFDSPVTLPNTGFVVKLSEEELENLRGPIQLLLHHFGEGKTEYTPLMRKRREYLLRLILAEVNAILNWNGEESVPKNGHYISQVFRYIDRHISEPLPLEELAVRFHVSRAKLTRDFREELHMSIGEYISSLRERRAAQLLLSGHSVSETAAECGFNSSSNFIRFFKKASGYTPMEYRKKFMNTL